MCMLVEEQHEAYWPLRWERRPGLKEGYTQWMSRRVVEGGKNRMLTAVARDRALDGEVVGASLWASVPPPAPVPMMMMS